MADLPRGDRRLDRYAGTLSDDDPALPLTRTGSPFIDWEQGMPLNRFIGLLCSPEGETAPLRA